MKKPTKKKKKIEIFKTKAKTIPPRASLETKDIRYMIIDELSIVIVRSLTAFDLLNKRPGGVDDITLDAAKDQLTQVMFSLNALREKI